MTSIALVTIFAVIAINWVCWKVRQREFNREPHNYRYNAVLEQQLETVTAENEVLRDTNYQLRQVIAEAAEGRIYRLGSDPRPVGIIDVSEIAS